MGLLVNIDGQIASTGAVSVLDRGFLYGDSIYEVVRTYRGKVIALAEHLARLRQSAAYLYLTVPWSDAELESEIERTLHQAGPGEYYIRIVVSRGAEATINLLPTSGTPPSLIIVVSEIALEPELSPTGISLKIVERQRNSRQSLDPAAKTGNYLNNILALLEARQQGAEDALLLNAAGEVAEATTSNFWIVRQGIVYTPEVDAGILHGVTRAYLLQILRNHGVPHRETALKPVDLWSAEEAFLSSSVRLLMPISRIDDYRLPHCPGPRTTWLWQQLLAMMAQEE